MTNRDERWRTVGTPGIAFAVTTVAARRVAYTFLISQAPAGPSAETAA